MLKKRLIGVITVRNGLAVQSIGYQRYLPLGQPWCIAENLDRWSVDEILILSIDRSKQNLGPDYNLIASLLKAKLSTPLIYGGGISSKSQAAQVIQAGADRVLLDNMLHESPEMVHEISETIGAQAIIASLPVSCHTDGILWYDYRNKQHHPFPNTLKNLFSENIISEAMIIDWINEGHANQFNQNIVDNLDFSVPLILFGGISEPDQISELLARDNVTAVSIGNFLNYQEHCVQTIKMSLSVNCLRIPKYQEHNIVKY